MRLPRYGYAFARNDRAVRVYDWLVTCKRAAFRFREIATSLRLTLEMTGGTIRGEAVGRAGRPRPADREPLRASRLCPYLQNNV